MAINLTTPVTGGAQTGFTTPTYTIIADTASVLNGKQWAVTALGGTQTGVNLHSASSPFTTAYFKPVQYKQLGRANPLTGLITNVPMNIHKFVTRKGVFPSANQPAAIMYIRTEVSVPANAETFDKANVLAGLSMHFGATAQLSAGVGDTVATNIL